MKIPLSVPRYAPLVVLAGLALFVAGCNTCKPGKSKPPVAYQIDVNLDPALKGKSVLVDVVGVNPVNLTRLDSYSMTQYWKPNDSMRNDVSKITFDFISGQSLSQSLRKNDPKWKNWLDRGATHVVVLADLPGQTDKPQDSRRLTLSLDPCAWPDKTTNLVVQVKPSGVYLETAPRPQK